MSAQVPGSAGVSWAWESGEPPITSVLIQIPLQEAKLGDCNAVVVEVSGEAFYIGTTTFTVEEEDPLKYGFFFK